MIARVTERWRRRAGSVLVDGFFRGASRAGRLHPDARPERHGVQVVRDVPYRETELPEHRLDVYRPNDVAAFAPVVLYVHGGGFRILSKDTHWLMGIAFARQGYVVLNVGYRLAPQHPFPAAVEDVCAAYEWAARHASDWGGDPTRLVVAGESAGANLVTGLVLASCWRRGEDWARRVWDTGVVPRAAIPACGIFQVSDVARFSRRKRKLSRFLADRLEEIESAYLGDEIQRHGEAIDFADPVRFLERSPPPERPVPPFFLPVGTKDPLLDDTRRLDGALSGLGIECEARYYEGEVHAFHAFVFRKNARRCWADTYDFLDRHLGPPPAPDAR